MPQTPESAAVVPFQPTAAVERQAPAANRALGGLPYLRQFMELANAVADSDMVPAAIKGEPGKVLAVVLAGYELGIGPMHALQSINMIAGKPSLSAELMRALILEAGHQFRVKATEDEATVIYRRSDWPADEWTTITYTMADAERAGHVEWYEKWMNTSSGKRYPVKWNPKGHEERPAWMDGTGVEHKFGDNYKSIPRAMLTARATSEAARADFADVIAGLSYTPEEVAQFTPAPAWEPSSGRRPSGPPRCDTERQHERRTGATVGADVDTTGLRGRRRGQEPERQPAGHGRQVGPHRQGGRAEMGHRARLHDGRRIGRSRGTGAVPLAKGMVNEFLALLDTARNGRTEEPGTVIEQTAAAAASETPGAAPQPAQEPSKPAAAATTAEPDTEALRTALAGLIPEGTPDSRIEARVGRRQDAAQGGRRQQPARPGAAHEWQSGRPEAAARRGHAERRCPPPDRGGLDAEPRPVGQGHRRSARDRQLADGGLDHPRGGGGRGAAEADPRGVGRGRAVIKIEIDAHVSAGSVRAIGKALRKAGAGRMAGAYLPDRLSNRRVFLGQRRSRVLHMAHGSIVIGNLPADWPGERLGHMFFFDSLGAGVEAVDHHFQGGPALGGYLLDQAVCIAQFGNAELRNQVKGHRLVEAASALQIQFRAGIHHHVFVILKRDFQKGANCFIGGLIRVHLAWPGKNKQTRVVLDEQRGKKMVIKPGSILKRADGGVHAFDAEIQRRVA